MVAQSCALGNRVGFEPRRSDPAPAVFSSSLDCGLWSWLLKRRSEEVNFLPSGLEVQGTGTPPGEDKSSPEQLEEVNQWISTRVQGAFCSWKHMCTFYWLGGKALAWSFSLMKAEIKPASSPRMLFLFKALFWCSLRSWITPLKEWV